MRQIKYTNFFKFATNETAGIINIKFLLYNGIINRLLNL